jgi:L-threonylcarbamoyladenylate synthase
MPEPTPHPAALLDEDAAVAALKRGGLLLFPTETVYGLGCDVLQAQAVAEVFLVKQRVPSMPLPVIVGAVAQLSLLTYAPTDAALALMEMFWPGPLSLLLPARRALPDLLTAHTGKVAVRQSPHPVAQRLCLGLGRPLVATSANISGKASALSADALDPLLLDRVAGFCNGEPAPAGGASTLVEASERHGRFQVRLCREGAVCAEVLRKAGFDIIEKR